VGAGLGVIVAAGGVQLMRTLATPNTPPLFQLVHRSRGGGSHIMPRFEEISMDVNVLAFAVAAAFLTALVFGSAPAVQLARVNHITALTKRPYAALSPWRSLSVRDLFSLAQVALATTLLVGAGLLVNSFVRLVNVDNGYNPANVLTFQLVIPQEYSAPRKAGLVERFIDGMVRTRGVDAAGFTHAPPLLGIQETLTFVPPGRTLEEMRSRNDLPQMRGVSRAYLRAMGVNLLAGRWLDDREPPSLPLSILISESTARRFFPKGDAIGTAVRLGNDPAQIVGVVQDVRFAGLDRPAEAMVYAD
jgi:hypothetical protein